MGAVSKWYLIFYNVVQTTGWSYLLMLLLPHLKSSLLDGNDSGELYRAVGPTLRLFQTAAVLEVIHATVGLVRSSVAITAMQLLLRLYITWGVVHVVPEAQTCRGFPLLLLAWNLIEVIRYSYYALQLLGVSPPAVTWLRYTLFIPLYPMGFVGEWGCQYVSLERIATDKVFSVEMPNAGNFTFNYYAFVITVMGFFFVGFPRLYLYMFAQRRKVLGGEIKKS